MSAAHEDIVMVLKLEESIRMAKLNTARKAYAASLAKILTWHPGDLGEALRVYAEALGDAQHLIAVLEGE